MQQHNVFGCREYLENVASNQSFQILSIVIIRAPFEYAIIWFRDSEPNTLRSIALHQTSCAWWNHSPTLLLIFRTSSWYLHQSFLWEDILQSQITTGDYWSCCEAWVMTRFSNFVLLSMFKGGFFPLGFCLFPWLNGHAVCKGWLSLVSRPYIFWFITHKVRLKGGC